MSVVRRYTYKADSTVLGGQEAINLDYLKLFFRATIVVDVVSGSANYGIEFTTDDMSGDPSTIRWLTDENSLPNGQTKTGLFALTTAVTAIRLNIQSMTGEIRLSVIQGLGV